MSKREAVINELLTTDESYLSDLTTLRDVYVGPLLREDMWPVAHFLPLLNTLIEIHKRFIQSLRQNIQERITPLTEIGSSFLLLIQDLQPYMSFIELYPSLLEELAANQPVRKFVEQYRQLAPHTHDIASYLCMPKGRLPRYMLLLVELQKLTPDGHRDKPVFENVILRLSKFFERVNETVNRLEAQKLLQELGKSMNDLPAHFLDSEIVLLSKHEGLDLRQNRDTDPCVVWIFRDRMLVAKPLDSLRFQFLRGVPFGSVAYFRVMSTERIHQLEIQTNERVQLVFTASDLPPVGGLHQALQAAYKHAREALV